MALSTPCDLAGASAAMGAMQGRPYMARFQRDILHKWALKRALFPGLIPEIDPGRQRTFRQIDDTFTAPLHGFADAREYWPTFPANVFFPQTPVPALCPKAARAPMAPQGWFSPALSAARARGRAKSAVVPAPAATVRRSGCTPR